MKNPWMSMWLSAANSAANSWASAARGATAAEMKRGQTAMIEEMTRQTMAFWTPPALAKAPARRRRKSKN